MSPSESSLDCPSSREEVKLLLLLDKAEDRLGDLASRGTTEGDHKVGFYVTQLERWMEKLETLPQ